MRRHNNPSLPLALRSQAFRNGLQISHQLGIARDVLTDLIDKEIKSESGCLRINIRFHLISKILNRQAVVCAKLIQHTDNSLAGDLAISLVYETLDPCRTRSPPLPIILGQASKMLLEALKHAFTLKLALKLCDIGLLAVIPAGLIEHFDEHSQQRINLRLADDVCFLIDIK